MSHPLLTALNRETQGCLRACQERIEHCVGQLTPEQVWWRPAPGLNSIGNLILHLNGNIRQWIISGLGESEDHRDRPREFSEQGPIPSQQLLDDLNATLKEACEVLDGLDEDAFQRPLRIQGFEIDAMGAIFDSVPHFKGHTQEIICLTRMQLGDRYQFHWQPSTPEEGA